ncbi:MAG: glycosyltransferase family 2 protein [Candidatus Omnitrophica bacterium]|nr:glycosyltransferase family 2 protein [Candidatus Omnitrophota bacterium]
MSKNQLLSIILPIHNEEENIEPLYERLAKVCQKNQINYEIIFVNDGSNDQGLQRVLHLQKKDSRVKAIDFSRNFGHQIAISAGMEFAKGAAVLVMDADLQDPPEMIPKFVEKWKQGFDVVYAIRKNRKGSPLKRIMYKLYYRILNKLADLDIPLDSGDFRLFSRRAVDRIIQFGEKRRYLRGLSSLIGFDQIGIEYDRPQRRAGKTKYSYRKLFNLAWEGVTALSIKPLRVATYLGVTVAFIAVAYMIRVFYMRLFTDTYIPGWSSLMTVLLLLGSVQLICIGIIGEYIGRTAEEVRDRPLYIIRKIYEKES